MLSLALIICLASSLLVVAFAPPTEPRTTVSAPKNVTPSILSPPTSPTLIPANNLTAAMTRRPKCWPDNPGLDPMKTPNPIAHTDDCFVAVLDMLYEGSDRELLVWDIERAWVHESCGLFLIPVPRLPIHRDAFSRDEIAHSVEIIQLACVNEKHGYRGGILPIAAGVFQVAVGGMPTQLSLGQGEEGIMNAKASKKRASTVQTEPLGSRDFFI